LLTNKRLAVALAAALAVHLGLCAFQRARTLRDWLGPAHYNHRFVEFLDECAREIPPEATVEVPPNEFLLVSSRLYPRRVVEVPPPDGTSPGAWRLRFTWPFDRAAASLERPHGR